MPARRIVTRVQVQSYETYDRVNVWNRGVSAGYLTVAPGDGCEIAIMMIGPRHTESALETTIVFEPECQP
jgi:hypothetical protein